MGIGPWQQAELIRDIQKAERDRFRRLVRRELRTVEEADANHSDGGEQALRRILAGIAPPKPKEKEKSKRRALLTPKSGHGF